VSGQLPINPVGHFASDVCRIRDLGAAPIGGRFQSEALQFDRSGGLQNGSSGALRRFYFVIQSYS